MEQLQPDGRWAPVLYCSKSLSETQQRYAQIEKEAYAIVWVCERLEEYLIGKLFTIQTDHLPLLSILKKKPINDLTVRLQRFRLKLTRFSFNIEHVAGKKFYVPDTLSRQPLKQIDNTKDILEEEVECYVNAIRKETEDNLKITYQNIEKAQKEELQKLSEYVIQGWPEKSSNIDEKCQKFFKYRNNITYYGNLLYYKDRLIIPVSMYKKTLEQIHIGHQGINSCKLRAKHSVWWPNIKNYITGYCTELLPMFKKPKSSNRSYDS